MRLHRVFVAVRDLAHRPMLPWRPFAVVALITLAVVVFYLWTEGLLGMISFR